MNKQDSKYFYTAELMNDALLSLLEKKDIEFITVTELTKKAGVNRSTFYLHYENIYELLQETIYNLNKQFVNSFDLKHPVEINSKNDAFLITKDFLVPYLTFCKKNKSILKLVNSKPHLFQSKNVYSKIYDTILYPAISQFLNNDTEKTYMLEFFTKGAVAIVYKWIELDCVTDINELITIIEKCINYAN